MFTNIGKKLCGLASFLAIVGAISIIIGVILFLLGFDDDFFFILGSIVAGSGLLLLIASWPVYAFGQITDDIHALREAQSPSVSANAQ